MPETYDLQITANETELSADLRLLDRDGNQIAWNSIHLRDHPPSRWEGLFDLRRYVRLYAGHQHPLGETRPLNEAGLIRELGLFLGKQVLGEEIMNRLGKGIGQRVLRLRFPGKERETGHLEAAFARVPWEIARLESEEDTLVERNILFRALTGAGDPTPKQFEFNRYEPLRVLLVFAEKPGARRPLAMQLERRELLDLFHKDIYPHRRVEVDTLCHGVTRERLEAQINNRGGYHIVHWSGHGHQNLLELYSEEEESSFITGQDLVQLFADAGGYLPRLVFLSACHSGNFLDLKTWDAFQAAVDGRDPTERTAVADAPAESLEKQVQEKPGYTGTALELLEAEIPTVVAMRYEVGDEYARDLAVQFYRHLLADGSPKHPDEALNQARGDLFKKPDANQRYGGCDHATPLLFGAGDCGLIPPPGNTPKTAIHPPLKIQELHAHEHFVGRSSELARLGAQWLAAHSQKPVALLRGLGGMGKTALAAEAISLWQEDFRWVFVFQAKPIALALDDFHRRLHLAWMDQQKDYADKVHNFPADAIWRQAAGEFTGAHRLETLRGYLAEALKAEPVLLVLDNFETNLKPREESTLPGHACQDPGWDDLLQTLANELAGSNSRVLITSRWPLAKLANHERVVDIPLGPLPPGEAALYVRDHPALRTMFFGQGDPGRKLVERLLRVSRGHPLLLDRLSRLAERDSAALEGALQGLQSKGLAQLPDYLAADSSDSKERKYLEDALSGSIDLLLERAAPDARRALWVLSLANEPAADVLWCPVWQGRTVEEEQLFFIKQRWSIKDQLSPEERQQLEQLIPEEMRQQFAQLPDDDEIAASVQEFDTYRQALIRSGLVTEQRDSEGDNNPVYFCHELVRERIAIWMENRPAETGGCTREQVWYAYGDRYVYIFNSLVENNQRAAALEAGSRALRYLVRAGAYERLGDFASQLINSTNDPNVLQALLPELEQAVAAAPPGKTRWSARTYLADALDNSGHHDVSLPYYQAAAEEAEQAEHWSDLSWIVQNWAAALVMSGQLPAAQEKFRESARYKRQAGSPEIDVLGSELEVLRIDVMLDKAEEKLAEIESAVQRIRAWWQASQDGKSVPQAPNREFLALAFIGALDILGWAYDAIKKWQGRLNCLDEVLLIKKAIGQSEHEIARNRFNRAQELIDLKRLTEAQTELESCLDIFERIGDSTMCSTTLSGLASLYDEKGDSQRAVALVRRALDIKNTLPDPESRAISHCNLCNYLHRLNLPADAAAHQLAALIYLLVTGHQQSLQTLLQNYVIVIRRAQEEGEDYGVLRVADLIARPDFAALRAWLAQWQVNLDELQQKVDDFIDKCRKAANQQ